MDIERACGPHQVSCTAGEHEHSSSWQSHEKRTPSRDRDRMSEENAECRTEHGTENTDVQRHRHQRTQNAEPEHAEMETETCRDGDGDRQRVPTHSVHLACSQDGGMQLLGASSLGSLQVRTMPGFSCSMCKILATLKVNVPRIFRGWGLRCRVHVGRHTTRTPRRFFWLAV